MRRLHLLSFALAALLLTCCTENPVSIDNLTVELLENPVGLDEQQPRFAWQIDTEVPNVMQTSYRIVVATSKEDLKKTENLLWDSGVVPTDQSTFIPYAGPQLESRKEYYWKVQVMTSLGDSVWSEPAHWSMALLNPTDWQAKWIGTDSLIGPKDRLAGETRIAARYLRKEFPVESKVKSAKLYITGLGLYECYINGERINDDVFAPTATDYTKSVNYNVFDVLEFLKGGENTIGVTLGNGRFVSMRLSAEGLTVPHGHRHFGLPKMLAQLEITYKDGSTSVITSDETWKITANGPIVTNSEFDGEEYDANLEMKNWSECDYDDSQWTAVQLVAAPEGKLVAQRNPNIKTMDTVDPIAVNQLNDSTYIVDMGQNLVGWLAINLKGEKGKPIKMRFAETLKADGSLYMDNLRGALVTDIYTPAVDGIFSWEPTFTYHGFRFVEITGLNYKPELNSFKGKVNYDEMETTGSFESSDEVINQIYKNAFWGIRGNYRSMPTDCPQRDERMGWLGDRATGCIGESFMFRQILLYEKWLKDIEQIQSENGCVPDVAPAFWMFDQHSGNVTWPAAYPCVVDMLYQQYGDTRPIKTHYASLKKWMDFIRDTQMKDNIVINDVYGDWCMPPERQDLIHSADPARKTDGRLLATSFYYRMLQLMTKFAALSGNEADIPAYQDLSCKIKEAYNKEFLHTENGQYVNNTVTANIISLMQGLTPDSLQNKVFENVVTKTKGEFNSHVSTGLIGIQFLMRGLTQYGQGDLAYTIATNKTYPSWGYMIDNGATTIWELWNGDTADPAMNSGNHVMLLGDLMTWYYENLAGIKSDPNQVGFKKIIMAPYFPEGLNWVDASYESLYGEIGSEWKKEDQGLNWEVIIPANTTASIRIPAASAEQVTENGQPLTQNPAIKSVQAQDGFVTVEVGSGKYNFLAAK